ncbi:hypothetical protein LTR10_016154 [Elasticomyces elasticus]|uniref:ABM domain-containing protein n=1 Tax=Exophiala sideris TaxID=1016849 RepID=A0ABR0JEH6_9EURO|nr:hypothetical protein LTR10_016154 [Elasticomyces elasticus]KAK5027600.1 hypothetical protein LTR13_009533 [Exophiala sideris]KAK5032837.1 hypothetical protein LTS07_004247 [Exophiala sideris]KAK5062361.1 hypothetical protein LTR69_004719 [Exophiala sideris]KAK5177519.1 hypothetical protein LTR44_009929 [Eurotiomycetes sp. CCFEE 6388]
MTPTTEVALIPLAEGQNPDDPTSAAGQTLKACFETVSKQDGYQRAYWGRQVENNSIGVAFIDWDSLDHHKKFMESEEFPSFMGTLVSLCSGPGKMYHVHWDNHPPVAALVGDGVHATEFLTVYFPQDYSADDQKAFDQNVYKFLDVCKGSAESLKAGYGGWIVEDLDDPNTSEKRKAWTAVVGWDKVESHLNFRNTPAFQDNVHLLKGAKDLKGLVNVHVAVKEWKQ